MMTLKQIKQAVDNGKIVYWSNEAYEVRKGPHGEYYIICTINDYTIGLVHEDGVTMNGEPEEFFVSEP